MARRSLTARQQVTPLESHGEWATPRWHQWQTTAMKTAQSTRRGSHHTQIDLFKKPVVVEVAASDAKVDSFITNHRHCHPREWRRRRCWTSSSLGRCTGCASAGRLHFSLWTAEDYTGPWLTAVCWGGHRLSQSLRAWITAQLLDSARENLNDVNCRPRLAHQPARSMAAFNQKMLSQINWKRQDETSWSAWNAGHVFVSISTQMA